VKRLSLSSAVAFCAVFSLALSPHSFCSEAEGTLRRMDDALARYQDSTYTLTIQNRVRGLMLPEQTIAVKTAKRGSIYMRWIGNCYKGRELLYRPGWNSDKAWIKEGGTMSFCAVSVGLFEPLITEESVHPITYFCMENLAREIRDWKENGTARIARDGYIMIERGDGNGTMAVLFSQKGFPERVEITERSGQSMEAWTLSDMHTNVGLSERDFEPGNPEYGFPGYSEQGIYVDPESLKTNLDRSWEGIKDYTCTLIKQERIKGRMQQKNTILLKFRKPCDLRLEWPKEPHKGRELIYRQGTDDKMLVRESGILGISPVRLSLDSWLTRGDTNHRITELDIGYAITMMHDNLYKALTRGDVRLTFLGTRLIGGRRAYMVECRLQNQKANGYYAARCITGHDQITGLPIKITNYDETNRMFEDLEWSELRFNVGLTDEDFNPNNPNDRF